MIGFVSLFHQSLAFFHLSFWYFQSLRFLIVSQSLLFLSDFSLFLSHFYFLFLCSLFMFSTNSSFFSHSVWYYILFIQSSINFHICIPRCRDPVRPTDLVAHLWPALYQLLSAANALLVQAHPYPMLLPPLWLCSLILRLCYVALSLFWVLTLISVCQPNVLWSWVS
jgi:hypothetical protein